MRLLGEVGLWGMMVLAWGAVLGQSVYEGFEARLTHPLELTPDGARLLAVHGEAGSLSVFDMTGAGMMPVKVREVPVGLEPVTVPADLDGRLELVGGDFFASAPAGADAYLLKHILHDWDDDACRTILRQIRAAMAPGGRVLILQQVIPPGNDPFPGKLADLNMLVMTEGGRERTSGEYALLLESAGLNLSRIHPTASAVSVVEAVAG